MMEVQIIDDRKTQFLESLKKNYGIIACACDEVGISRREYYEWRAADALFSEDCDEIAEIQGDFVESKLMTLIDAGDPTAITFYCKTKLAGRGFSTKAVQVEQPYASAISVPEPEVVEKEPERMTLEQRKDLLKPVEQWRTYIRRILNADGTYKPKHTYQVTLAAQSLRLLQECYLQILRDEESHRFVTTEISREGNERMSENPQMTLYIKLDAMCRKNLSALGMNMDRLIAESGLSNAPDPLKELMEKMQ